MATPALRRLPGAQASGAGPEQQNDTLQASELCSRCDLRRGTMPSACGKGAPMSHSTGSSLGCSPCAIPTEMQKACLPAGSLLTSCRGQVGPARQHRHLSIHHPLTKPALCQALGWGLRGRRPGGVVLAHKGFPLGCTQVPGLRAGPPQACWTRLQSSACSGVSSRLRGLCWGTPMGLTQFRTNALPSRLRL